MGLIFNRCKGGHHYKDKPQKTNKKILAPTRFSDKTLGHGDEIQLVEIRKYDCQHENCRKTKTEENVLKSYDRTKIEELLYMIENKGYTSIMAGIEARPEKEVRKSQCRVIADQISRGEYENLTDLHNHLKIEFKNG